MQAPRTQISFSPPLLATPYSKSPYPGKQTTPISRCAPAPVELLTPNLGPRGTLELTAQQNIILRKITGAPYFVSNCTAAQISSTFVGVVLIAPVFIVHVALYRHSSSNLAKAMSIMSCHATVTYVILGIQCALKSQKQVFRTVPITN